MNVEKVRRLADKMRQLEDVNPGNFGMAYWGHDVLLAMAEEGDIPSEDSELRLLRCDTPMCIAGWAVWLDEDAYHEFVAGFTTVYSVARRTLELDETQARLLFTPGIDGDPPLPSHVTPYLSKPHQVALVLDHMALTGEVDWGRMREVNDA